MSIEGVQILGLIWQKNVNGQCYEIRNAGKTLRLYSDGVFHSQYHPERDWLGGVWDLLYLPGFWQKPCSRVLLLGLGAGAAVHPIMKWLNPDQLDAVEINPTHIQLAKKFFDVNYPKVTIHHADARSWLEQTDNKYDLIIDDLYGHENGEPVRGVEFDANWWGLLVSRLSHEGSLVINYTAKKDLIQTQWLQSKAVRRRIPSGAVLTTSGYLNHVAWYAKTCPPSRQLRSEIPSILKKVDFSLKALKAIIRPPNSRS